MARVGLHPPSGCACGGVLAGWRVCRRTHPLRDLTRRICPNAAAQQRSELCGAPRKHPDAGCPAGAADCGARFFASFLVARQERRSPAGASPGLRALQIPHPYSQALSCRPPAEHAARTGGGGAQAQDCTLRVFWGFELKGQAQAAIVFIVTGMPLQRAEAGSRPGGRGTCSLLRQRKVPKRKATLLSASLRCAPGNPRCSVLAGSRSNSRLRRSNNREP